jgi:UDP-3-O-acyl-N-acetylglucosamine deacetylase
VECQGFHDGGTVTVALIDAKEGRSVVCSERTEAKQKSKIPAKTLLVTVTVTLNF